MWQKIIAWIKSQFTTDKRNRAMLKERVAKFHGELVVNNRQSNGQTRRWDRKRGERMAEVNHTNKLLEDVIERAARKP